MVNMQILNESEILYNIRIRYEMDNIFTYIGPTLIVINPYKKIEENFNNEKISKILNILK
jgi:myosin heavy subunit